MKNFIFALSAALLLAGCASSSQNANVPQGKCEVKVAAKLQLAASRALIKHFYLALVAWVLIHA